MRTLNYAFSFAYPHDNQSKEEKFSFPHIIIQILVPHHIALYAGLTEDKGAFLICCGTYDLHCAGGASAVMC
jgi:hypothetical protein